MTMRLTQLYPKHPAFHMTGPMHAACSKYLMPQQSRPGLTETGTPPNWSSAGSGIAENWQTYVGLAWMHARLLLVQEMCVLGQ